MSFNRPTLSALIDQALADFDTRMPGADSRLRASVIDVLARVHSGAVAGLYGYLDFIARQILPDTAEAEYLARWASIWGLYRKAATAASGIATATGVNGSVILAGAELARSDGQRFTVTADAVITAGTAALAVVAGDSGVSGNLAAADSLTFVNPVAGVNAVVAIAAPGLSGGAAEEDDAALLSRLLLRIRTPPQGGARADYERWALTLPGATRAWVYPQYLGIGTVGLTFVFDGREDILPLPADLDAMAAVIEPLRPVTAEVFVFAPVALPIDIRLRIAPDTLAVRAAVEAELRDMFARDAAPGGVIRLSRLREAISVAAGESWHDLELPSADIVAAPGDMPMLGDIEWLA